MTTTTSSNATVVQMEAEVERFEASSTSTRFFICLTRSIEAKKICLLILAVLLILLVQLIQLIHPPDLLANGSGQQFLAAAKHWSDAADQLVHISRKLVPSG